MNFTSENVVAYYQPILAVDSNTVYSYEVLGRYVDDGGAVQSLGAFFADAGTKNDEALVVDRLVRRYALRQYAAEKRDEYLFINIRLAWMAKYADRPEALPTLQWLREFGISPKKLVIEITEEEFNKSEAYLNVLTYYKDAGCRIAIDDYGKNASNVDRIALIKPDIIKINMDYIHKSEKSYHYREYLKAIADFAESIGSEVLYEGVETQRQLDICMALGGRFYQGFLTAVPQASMRGAVVNHAPLTDSIKNSYRALRNKIANSETLKKSLDPKIERFLQENPFHTETPDMDAYLTGLCHALPETVRVYLCDKRGNQITRNVERRAGVIEYCDYKGKNWAWRGYFYEAMRTFMAGGRSCLSAPYRDFTTKKQIFTYAYALNEDTFLFADV